jgi:ABC-type sugar transport system substrate-binding protein
MALGAVEAIAARNLTGKIAVVGVDATGKALHAIDSGRINADVAMHPEALGNKAVVTAIQAAKGQPVDKTIDTGETLVTKDNVAQFK